MKQKKKRISGIDIIGILLFASIIWGFIYFLLAWIFGVSIDVCKPRWFRLALCWHFAKIS